MQAEVTCGEYPIHIGPNNDRSRAKLAQFLDSADAHRPNLCVGMMGQSWADSAGVGQHSSQFGQIWPQLLTV